MGAAVREAALVANPTRAWRMRLTDEADALVRVLTVLRRRRCRILDVRYQGGDPRSPTTVLRVLVRPLGGRPDALEAWLRALPDVLEIAPDT